MSGPGRSGAVDVSAVADVDHCHDARVIVNSADHSIASAARAVPILKRREEPLADPVRVLEQRTGNELQRGESRRLRQGFGKVPYEGRDILAPSKLGVGLCKPAQRVRLTSSDRWLFTSPSGIVVIVRRMTKNLSGRQAAEDCRRTSRKHDAAGGTTTTLITKSSISTKIP